MMERSGTFKSNQEKFFKMANGHTNGNAQTLTQHTIAILMMSIEHISYDF